jgi:hypothetical protein
MGDANRQRKRSQWWASGGDVFDVLLVVLFTLGWVIVGLFRSLASRSKSFGLRDLFFLVAGIAILLGLVAMAIH